MKRNSGFTLAEVLVASSISVLVAASLLTVFMMGRRTWSEASAQVTLQSNARLILNQIARGSRGMFGLREANYSSITVEEDGRSIRFWVDKNETTTPTTIRPAGFTCRMKGSGTILTLPLTWTSILL